MSEEPPFERSVFINCPFDKDYAPILQAIAFCVVDMGFYPRLAPENSDHSASRLSAHHRVGAAASTLRHSSTSGSRCKRNTADEYYRLQHAV